MTTSYSSPLWVYSTVSAVSPNCRAVFIKKLATESGSQPPTAELVPRSNRERLDGGRFCAALARLAQGRNQRSLKEVRFSLRLPLRQVFSEESSVRLPSNERRMSDQIE